MPAGPGDPGGPRYDAPQKGCPVLAYRQLRARASVLVGEGAAAARARPMADDDAGALNDLASGIAEAQHCVSSLRGGEEPIASR